MYRKKVLSLLLVVLLAASCLGQITDQFAVTYSRDHTRASANVLAQSYYWAISLVDRWNALGGGQEALDDLRDELRRSADFLGKSTHQTVHRASLVWLTHQSLTGNPPIPNTTDVVEDGITPTITGQDANEITSRNYEYLTWGDTGSFDPTPNGGGGGPWLYTIIDLSPSDGRDPDLNSAQLYITRLNELIADYEANSNAKLNTILQVATSTVPPQREAQP